ncbi:MAG: outer membrane murein-binding lipoprotein Lpp [Bacteroidia bacterium]|jgi:outer membrane murein-binding lipoprotein Lpp
MNKSVLKIVIVAFIGSSILVGCGAFKKLLDAQIEQFSLDSNTYKAELDQVDNDINNALADIDGFNKTDYHDEVFSSPLCGVTIDCTDVSQGILYFNFDGVTPCFSYSRTRGGQIKVELINGNSWADAGAVLKQTFTDFRVTNLFTLRSIEFDGIKTLKNVSGHDWWQFLLGNQNFTHESRSNDIQVSFDNGANTEWNHARSITWSYNPAGTDPNVSFGYIGFTASGDTTINGVSNMDSWGVNRFGDDFITYYNQPLLSNTYCGLWRFNSGQLVHEVDGDDYILTLGVDQNGNSTSNTCAYGYEVSWDVGNNSNNAVFSY